MSQCVIYLFFYTFWTFCFDHSFLIGNMCTHTCSAVTLAGHRRVNWPGDFRAFKTYMKLQFKYKCAQTSFYWDCSQPQSLFMACELKVKAANMHR